MFYGSLATWHESRITCEIYPMKDFSNSNMCFSRGLFRWSEVKSKSWASCENLLFTNSSPKSHAQPLHKIPQKYREMMKQNYNQIWHVIKANIYIVVVVVFFFFFFFLETTYIYSCKSQIYTFKSCFLNKLFTCPCTLHMHTCSHVILG